MKRNERMAPTACVLGFASQPWSPEIGTWYDTHIGGEAIWPEGSPPTIKPCPRCQAQRYLVLQAFAPHAAHPNRVIQLYGCNNGECSRHADTWLAWRICEITSPVSASDGDAPCDHQIASTGPSKDSRASEINWDEEDESTDSDDDLFIEKMAVLSLEAELARKSLDAAQVANPDRLSTTPSNTKNPNTENSTLSSAKISTVNIEVPAKGPNPSFPAFFVDVQTEPLEVPSKDDVSVNRLLQNYLNDEKTRPTKDGSENWVAETDDDDTPSTRAFEAFHAAIARAPAQILRYAFAVPPVWPTHPAPSVPVDEVCACGSSFVPELQILGSCLHFLAVDSGRPAEGGEARMSFASLALYTCAKDCVLAPVEYDTRTYQAFSQVLHVLPDD